MNRIFTFIALIVLFLLQSCLPDKKENKHSKVAVKFKDALIVDSHYTFNEAIAGSKAPKDILNQLQLMNVKYYSLDGKIHQGQILTNKIIAHDLILLFEFILYTHFPIAHAIPIVKYQDNDDLSMQENNTYSFCYRNASYSKHANGMAIDINPFFNPVRWKVGYENRTDKPIGAVNNPEIAGTFYLLHPVVLKFKEFGFRWGHNFTRNYDDHHFEK
ncbi:MAG: M15 family metallopeptidase [Paludibacter sp.]